MFQNLRTNSQVYILHKVGEPYIEYGNVMSVTAPKPKYPMSPGPVGQFPQMEMVVDVTVNVRGQQVPLKDLKANADIDDNGSIVVSCSKEAINSEISLMQQKSLDILNSIDYHKRVIASCDKMLNSLNPEIAAKQEQEQRIQSMESQISTLASAVNKLVSMYGGNAPAEKPDGSEIQKQQVK